ncbi:hypothetical protein [Streptomyces sp. NPDC050504]|uniref:hypothetical protein n=1 Tax=Streptomyces sp. NPDC050504 TaxID=3365618 RepID=UPI00378DDCDB
MRPQQRNPPLPVPLDLAEAALVEHYPRLVRIGYLVLPPALGRNRRVLTAHSLVQRALPRGRAAAAHSPAVPAPRGARPGGDPGYAYVRARVLKQAIDAGLPLRRRGLPRRAQLPPLLPQVWGLRLFPRSGGADELVLNQRLSALPGPARAAYALRGIERLEDPEVRRVLTAAGVTGADADAALALADGVRPAYELLESPEFDPCSLQARPTDLMRRRQHAKAALAASAALLVCGVLLGLPGEGWGPDGAAAPVYARNPAAERALDPGALRRVAPAEWRHASRADFSVWPTRGDRAADRALLRRALAVWARPGTRVETTATPGTPVGPPMGPAQLLYAGVVDGAAVVLFFDGLRVVRYAEPVSGQRGAALDFARVDGAAEADAQALVVGRTASGVRYLTAPWVRAAKARDLLRPAAPGAVLPLGADGVTAPLAAPARAGDCRSWAALELRGAAATRLLTDLGELAPARLTSGAPGAPKDVVEGAGLAGWARTACLLPAFRSHGVRSVNSWQFARQPLPEDGGTARWLCTRAETWRGGGSRVFAQFQAPAAAPAAPGAVAARAESSPACGERYPKVLAGVLWKSRGGSWYVLAAGSNQLVSVAAFGGVTGSARGPLLTVPAKAGARAELAGRLADGTGVAALR